MKKVSFDRFANSAAAVPQQKEESYLLSYKEFVDYFEQLERITSHNFIIATHFTYGWMPTILKLKGLSKEAPLEALYPHLVNALNKVKNSIDISEMELALLIRVVNNSLVGVSKLLHVINPLKYAIWDSRVYRYINGKKPHNYQIIDIKNFKAYLLNCKEISDHDGFHEIHADINNKMGYNVSAYRAIEWVMFMSDT